MGSCVETQGQTSWRGVTKSGTKGSNSRKEKEYQPLKKGLVELTRGSSPARMPKGKNAMEGKVANSGRKAKGSGGESQPADGRYPAEGKNSKAAQNSEQRGVRRGGLSGKRETSLREESWRENRGVSWGKGVYLMRERKEEIIKRKKTFETL